MNSFERFVGRGRMRARLHFGAHLAFGVLFALSLLAIPTALAQVVPAADVGGFSVFAGGAASAATLQYGQRKMLGVSAVVDVESWRRLGLEGEARWLVFHSTAQVNAATWLAGPRYRVHLGGKFQVYAKVLAGVGEFNFPYNDAHGRYLVIAPGGGVDFALSPRVRLRLADCEFQDWPQFTFGPMSSLGIGSGVRIRVF